MTRDAHPDIVPATADDKGNIILTDPNSSLTGDGSINLRATTDEVNYEAKEKKSTANNDTKKAEVTVGYGTTINAAGNVEISSNVVDAYDLKDFHFLHKNQLLTLVIFSRKYFSEYQDYLFL